MLAELTDILGRRKFATKVSASLLTINRLVEDYAQLAAVVRPAATPRIAPDPKDDVVIGTALASKAEMIVTGDKSLLSVIEHESVRIVGVAQAIEAIDVRNSA